MPGSLFSRPATSRTAPTSRLEVLDSFQLSLRIRARWSSALIGIVGEMPIQRTLRRIAFAQQRQQNHAIQWPDRLG